MKGMELQKMNYFSRYYVILSSKKSFESNCTYIRRENNSSENLLPAKAEAPLEAQEVDPPWFCLVDQSPLLAWLKLLPVSKSESCIFVYYIFKSVIYVCTFKE